MCVCVYLHFLLCPSNPTTGCHKPNKRAAIVVVVVDIYDSSIYQLISRQDLGISETTSSYAIRIKSSSSAFLVLVLVHFVSKTHWATRRRRPALLTASCKLRYFPGHTYIHTYKCKD